VNTLEGRERLGEDLKRQRSGISYRSKTENLLNKQSEILNGGDSVKRDVMMLEI
jgi:hypothetical protein